MNGLMEREKHAQKVYELLERIAEQEIERV